MAQRPRIKQPRPVTAPTAPERLEADAQMLGAMKAEVSPEAAPLWDFVLRHARTIAVAVLGVIVIVMAVAAWQWQLERAAAAARNELGRVSATLDPAARLAGLEAFAASAPAAVYAATQLELAQAAAQSENWEKAAAAYSALIEREPDSPLGLSARFNLADLLLRQGKAAEAVTELETILLKAPDEFKPYLHEQIGEAAEAAGLKDKAVSAYEAAVAALKDTTPAEAAYYQSRIAALR
ncbi:MAG: tetratricopeptide repeat protein [Desulfovibrionaceae bacterium]|nr:tetratricopeptide repeat protein [Desulfovibrionaceae bacterium]